MLDKHKKFVEVAQVNSTVQYKGKKDLLIQTTVSGAISGICSYVEEGLDCRDLELTTICCLCERKQAELVTFDLCGVAFH